MKVSVIIPVYKVEQYLRRCVDSVINQSYRDLELILVDDGSPDRSPVICDEYSKKDTRIRVIHKKNGGLSSARNAGIAAATGEYVTFVDSDDWIDPSTVEHSIDLIRNYHADVVEYAMVLAEDERPAEIVAEKVDIYQDKEILQYYMTSTTMGLGGYSVCMSLFRKELLENIFFREGKINEDIDFKYRVLSRANIMVVTNQKFYYYFQPGESLSMGGLKRRDFDLYESAIILSELTSHETYGTIAKLGRVKLARTPFSLLSKIAYFGVADSTIDENAIVRSLTKEHRRNLCTLLSAPIPFSRKLLSVMFSVNFKLTKGCIAIVRKFM